MINFNTVWSKFSQKVTKLWVLGGKESRVENTERALEKMPELESHGPRH